MVCRNPRVVLERFTHHAREVLILAGEEGGNSGQRNIGAEHCGANQSVRKPRAIERRAGGWGGAPLGDLRGQDLLAFWQSAYGCPVTGAMWPPEESIDGQSMSPSARARLTASARL
jgi:hypothetical protein